MRGTCIIPYFLFLKLLLAETIISKNQKICKDALPWKDCDFYKGLGYCKTRSERLRNLCPQTCDLCEHETPIENQCLDEDGPFNCRYLQQHGACYTHADLMVSRCAKTCNLCDIRQQCTLLNCPKNKLCVFNNETRQARCECPVHCTNKEEYESLGSVCGTDGKTYKDYCHLQRHSCRENSNITVGFYGVCPGDEPCEDGQQEKESGFCDSWKILGLCKEKNYIETLKKYCSRTCNLCPEKRALFPSYSCHSSPYGCCWDWTEKPSSGESCKACKDRNPVLCTAFIKECNSAFRSNMHFMKTNCPSTCGFCSSQVPSYNIKIYDQSGKKLLKSEKVKT